MKNDIGYGCNENAIEWIKDENVATLSLSQRRLISKIEKLAKSRPKECNIIARNEDGSICAHIPRNWVKINPSRQMTDDQRRNIAERLSRK